MSKIKKIVLVLTICIFIGSLISSIILENSVSTNGGRIEGTGFIEHKRPVALSDNFGVDSKENIYFSSQSSAIIQIFDCNNQYLYTLDLEDHLNRKITGAKYVKIRDDDSMEIYIVRSNKVATFDKSGFLISEKDIETNEFISILMNAIPSYYSVEKNGVAFYSEPQNNFFYSIYKQNGNEKVLLYRMQFEEILFHIFRTLAICLIVTIVVIMIIKVALSRIKARQRG